MNTWSLVRNVMVRMHHQIEDATGTTAYDPLGKSEIKEVVMRWQGQPPGVLIASPMSRAWWGKCLKWITNRTWRYDRLWDTSCQYDSNGGFESVTWRRRSKKQADRAKLVLLVLGVFGVLGLCGVIALLI